MAYLLLSFLSHLLQQWKGRLLDQFLLCQILMSPVFSTQAIRDFGESHTYTEGDQTSEDQEADKGV